MSNFYYKLTHAQLLSALSGYFGTAETDIDHELSTIESANGVIEAKLVIKDGVDDVKSILGRVITAIHHEVDLVKGVFEKKEPAIETVASVAPVTVAPTPIAEPLEAPDQQTPTA